MNYSNDILEELSRIQRVMCDLQNHRLAVYLRDCAFAHMLKGDPQQKTLAPSVSATFFAGSVR